MQERRCLAALYNIDKFTGKKVFFLMILDQRISSLFSDFSHTLRNLMHIKYFLQNSETIKHTALDMRQA